MVDALLHNLCETRSKPATMLTLVLIPYWAPSTIETVTVILQDQLFPDEKVIFTSLRQKVFRAYPW
jgi:hypothetical protein